MGKDASILLNTKIWRAALKYSSDRKERTGNAMVRERAEELQGESDIIWWIQINLLKFVT